MKRIAWQEEQTNNLDDECCENFSIDEVAELMADPTQMLEE